MSIVQIAALFTASMTLVGSAWYALDYTKTRPVILMEFQEAQENSTQILKGLVEQQNIMQQQLSTSIMELQFQTLDLKKKEGSLDWSEQQTYCRLAKKLDYVNVDDCDH